MFRHRVFVSDAEGKSFPITLANVPPMVRSQKIDSTHLERISKEICKTVGTVVVITDLAIKRSSVQNASVASVSTTKNTQFVTPQEHSAEAAALAGEYVNLLPQEFLCTDVAIILEPSRKDSGIIAVVDNFALVVRSAEGKSYYEADAYVLTADLVKSTVSPGTYIHITSNMF